MTYGPRIIRKGYAPDAYKPDPAKAPEEPAPPKAPSGVPKKST